MALLYVYVYEKAIGQCYKRRREGLCNIYVDVLFQLWYHRMGGDSMPTSESQKRASIAYNRRQDSITLRPSKEEGQKIRDAAQKAGKSLQGYILDILRKNM